MSRQIRSLAVLVSALACACVVAVWVVSHWGGMLSTPLSAGSGAARFLVVREGTAFLVTQRAAGALDGTWVVEMPEFGRIDVRSDGARIASLTTNGYAPPRGRLGFSNFTVPGPSLVFGTPGGGGIARCSVVSSGFGVPLWFLLVLTAALPSVAVVWNLRQRRRAARFGLCAACGYDLRASPDRCPECGTIPLMQPT